MDEEAPARPPRPVVTWLLVAANFGAFIWLLRAGGNPLLFDAELLTAFGGVDAGRVWAGEVWRLASGMFLHAAVWHLGLNLWVLWQVGRLLEQVLGPPRYLLVYLVSGSGGFALSLVLQPGLTLGASGAIFGVIGGLLALSTVAREQPVSRFLTTALVPLVAATFALGLLLPFLDNSAHVGGFVLGYALTYGLLADSARLRLVALAEAGRIEGRDALRLRPRFGAIALWGSLLLFAALLPLGLRPVHSPRYQTARGHAALACGDLDGARRFADQAAVLAPDDPAVLVLRGRLLLEGDAASRGRAQGFFQEALRRLDPEDAAAAFARALLEAGGRGEEEMLFRDPPLTRGLCDAALAAQAGAPQPALLNNCAWLLAKTGDPRARDVLLAKRLAARAVRLARPSGRPQRVGGPELAAYLHTWAYALAEAGDPEEARAVLERVRAEGLSDAPFYEEERRRFDAMSKKARRRAAEGHTPAASARPPTEVETPGGAGDAAAP